MTADITLTQWTAEYCHDTFDFTFGEHRGWIWPTLRRSDNTKVWRVTQCGEDGSWREINIPRAQCRTRKSAILFACSQYPERPMACRSVCDVHYGQIVNV